MNNKIDDLQKQLDTLNHMLLKVQAELDNEKAKEQQKAIFYYLDDSSSLECYSEAVVKFSSKGADFGIRCFGKYKDKGFYLGPARSGSECPWEIVNDGTTWVLKLKEIE